jgi:hypothetical protein
MAKLIQICASENDLFGLDSDGVVFQFNFNTKNWIRLPRGRADQEARGRADQEGPPATDGQSSTASTALEWAAPPGKS